MILTDKIIKMEIKAGSIAVNPYPDEIQFQPASVDLRLGKEFKKMKSLDNLGLDYEWVDGSNYGGSCILLPGESVLGHTEEIIYIGNRIVGRVEGRSSWGRRFLSVHSTAGFIDPGFNGQITLEITNHGNSRILLEPGEKICQIVFEEAYSSDRLYGDEALESKYQFQSGAQEDKL